MVVFCLEFLVSKLETCYETETHLSVLWHVLHLTVETWVKIESQVAVFYEEAKKKKNWEIKYKENK